MFVSSLSLVSASGLLNSKETAQEYVLTGVGLLAGSTILLLTVIWGTCVILGNIDFGASRDTSSAKKPFQRLRAFVTGSTFSFPFSSFPKFLYDNCAIKAVISKGHNRKGHLKIRECDTINTSFLFKDAEYA